MLTAIQAQTAKAIVNIFETSTVLGDYGNVTVIQGDTGHLTFGRSQTTLGSGNLHQLVQQYCDAPGARFRDRLAVFLPRLAARDVSLDLDRKLQNILRASADDPAMRATQDRFFDEAYWRPAEKAAGDAGIASALGVAVVYDSTVHGSWALVRDMTNQVKGKLAALGERKWIAAYVETRLDWLANHSNAALHPTVYRMEAFRGLIGQGAWDLALPLVVRGLEISSLTLSATPPNCHDGPPPGSRALAVQSPLLRGLDVRLVQLGLSDQGMDIKADGIFGQGSSQSIKAFQTAQGISPATGIADASLIARLVG